MSRGADAIRIVHIVVVVDAAVRIHVSCVIGIVRGRRAEPRNKRKKSALYEGTNFAHFCEPLEEREGIAISYTALSRVLKGAGIVSKRGRRGVGRKFTRRKRRGRFGELAQADAAPFDWFGGRLGGDIFAGY